ncbi:hypothetical protein ET475_05240 [Microbacterium protaetiae]|uniref:Uncharacterized protein n=1 Tax=Microbacterium protaetiae TaxID=2509458 RepID=A0A4P6ECT6_9MICO|nr:hypothetical protein [Microbacterium protaetiae]QAY59456.1 hypothetical protein ET475_05240 [Microbacterium protaetiae]
MDNTRTMSAQRRLRKFLARSAPGVGQPIVDLRDPDRGEIALTIIWEGDSENGPWRSPTLRKPMLDKYTLDGVIAECRVFFLTKEDCYLPSVVKALQAMVTREQAIARRPLAAYVAQVVRGNELVMPAGRAPMYAGRLEADNGLGPNKLLGSHQITMDYIYGALLHEDDERRKRLDNLADVESIRFAVILQLDSLLRVVTNVRAQIEHDLSSGYFSLGGVSR